MRMIKSLVASLFLSFGLMSSAGAMSAHITGPKGEVIKLSGLPCPMTKKGSSYYVAYKIIKGQPTDIGCWTYRSGEKQVPVVWIGGNTADVEFYSVDSFVRID